MADESKTNLPQPQQKVVTPLPPSETVEENPCCEVLQRLEIEAPEILSQLPREQRRKLLSIVTTHLVMKHHQGPLPTPEDIALYNQHIPNGADRIMAMAEKQADHRREMESSIVTTQNSQSSRGQLFGLLIGIFGIVTGAIVTLMGHDVVGGGIAGATVISLVYAFITGQRAQRQEPTRPPPPASQRK